MLKAAPDAKAYDIYSLLQEQGYTGSMRTLERRIASIKGELPKERFFEQKYTPGEQAQFDFKEKVSLPFICATASPFGTVSINKSSYSVPDNLIGVNCRLVLDAYRLRVYRAADARKLIVEYCRIEGGEHKLELVHILPSLVRKPHAMVRWAHRELLFPSKSCHKYFAFLARVNPEAQEREYLKTLNLIQYVTLAEIEIAMDIVRKNNSKAPFDDAKFLLLCSNEVNQQSIEQTPLRPSLAIYDEFIPNNLEDTA